MPDAPSYSAVRYFIPQIACSAMFLAFSNMAGAASFEIMFLVDEDGSAVLAQIRLRIRSIKRKRDRQRRDLRSMNMPSMLLIPGCGPS
jgi:hypothetical protein